MWAVKPSDDSSPNCPADADPLRPADHLERLPEQLDALARSSRRLIAARPPSRSMGGPTNAGGDDAEGPAPPDEADAEDRQVHDDA